MIFCLRFCGEQEYHKKWRYLQQQESQSVTFAEQTVHSQRLQLGMNSAKRDFAQIKNRSRFFITADNNGEY